MKTKLSQNAVFHPNIASTIMGLVRNLDPIASKSMMAEAYEWSDARLATIYNLVKLLDIPDSENRVKDTVAVKKRAVYLSGLTGYVDILRTDEGKVVGK